MDPDTPIEIVLPFSHEEKTDFDSSSLEESSPASCFYSEIDFSSIDLGRLAQEDSIIEEDPIPCGSPRLRRMSELTRGRGTPIPEDSDFVFSPDKTGSIHGELRERFLDLFSLGEGFQCFVEKVLKPIEEEYELIQSGTSEDGPREFIFEMMGIDSAEEMHLIERNLAIYDLSCLLGWDVIPETTFNCDKEPNVILMRKVEGLTAFSFYAHIGHFHRSEEEWKTLGVIQKAKLLNNPKFQEDLLKLQILDWLVGSIDRHNGNWMLELTDSDFEEEAEYSALWWIDNDFCLSSQVSPAAIDGYRHYFLKKLPHVITPEIKDAVERVSEEDLIKLLEDFKNEGCPEISGFKKSEIKALVERYVLLLAHINSEKCLVKETLGDEETVELLLRGTEIDYKKGDPTTRMKFTSYYARFALMIVNALGYKKMQEYCLKDKSEEFTGAITFLRGLFGKEVFEYLKSVHSGGFEEESCSSYEISESSSSSVHIKPIRVEEILLKEIESRLGFPFPGLGNDFDSGVSSDSEWEDTKLPAEDPVSFYRSRYFVVSGADTSESEYLESDSGSEFSGSDYESSGSECEELED